MIDDEPTVVNTALPGRLLEWIYDNELRDADPMARTHRRSLDTAARARGAYRPLDVDTGLPEHRAD